MVVFRSWLIFLPGFQKSCCKLFEVFLPDFPIAVFMSHGFDGSKQGSLFFFGVCFCVTEKTSLVMRFSMIREEYTR